MIQNVLRAIGGVGVYDTISICLFVLVFCGALLWAARMPQPFLNRMSTLPLEDESSPATGTKSHE
jgi:hypothetical protein